MTQPNQQQPPNQPTRRLDDIVAHIDEQLAAGPADPETEPSPIPDDITSRILELERTAPELLIDASHFIKTALTLYPHIVKAMYSPEEQLGFALWSLRMSSWLFLVKELTDWFTETEEELNEEIQATGEPDQMGETD